MSNHGKTEADGNGPAIKSAGDGAQTAQKPDWADGLKTFYDSVVDEPLPDELAQLLARFDDDEA